MKASHVQIGNSNGNMVNPKPVPAIESSCKTDDFDVNDARKRLS